MGHQESVWEAYHIYGMYNVLFHIILLAYLLASLLFWLAMGLRQRWLFHLASGLLGGGFGLQTAVLGYRLSMQMFLWWGDVATSLELLSWAIIAVYWVVMWRYRIEALAAFIVPLAFLAAGCQMPSGGLLPGSQPGAGATFFFTLPAKPAAASQSNHDAISKPVSTRNS